MSDPGFDLSPQTKESIKRMLQTDAGKAVGEQLREKLKIIGAKIKETTSDEDKASYIKEIQETVSSTLSKLTKDLQMEAEEIVKNVDEFTPNYMLFAIAALLITLLIGS